MHRALACVFLFLLCVGARGAVNDSTQLQAGRLASVRLVKTERLPPGSAPDGLAFHFLVSPTPEAFGLFSIRETRDILVGGQSYQEKNQAVLGRRFEPQTRIDDAAKFFSGHAAFRPLMPKLEKGALVLSISLGGAKLPDDGAVGITVEIGFDRQLEQFAFRTTVPAR